MELSVFSIYVIYFTITGRNSANERKVVHENKHNFNSGKRIVGGHNSHLGQFPFLVSIQRFEQLQNEHFCGGSIITKKVILTAAHCFDDEDLKATKHYAVAGIISLNQNNSIKQQKRIVTIVAHPNYDKFLLQNDLLLAFLDTPFVFNSYVNYIKIGKEPPKINLICQVAGWGLLQFDSEGRIVANDNLKYLNLTVLSKETCSVEFKEYWVSDIMLCAKGTVGEDTCRGDSGGPLVCHSVQVGLVSYGSQYCATGNSTAFTDTTYFHDWITTHSERSASSKNIFYFLLNLFSLLRGLSLILGIQL